MSFDTTIEIVGIIISVVGGGIGVFAWLLKFIIRPTIELYRNQKRSYTKWRIIYQRYNQ